MGRRKARSSTDIVLIPILLLAAGLMVVPGLWAVGLLSGMEVPGSHKDGARTMAIMMLVSWPVAAGLFITAMVKMVGLKRG